jgi:hypothetical protein
MARLYAAARVYVNFFQPSRRPAALRQSRAAAAPWCRGQKLEVTRSRAYNKNDQAFVEQKNGAVVRRLKGYGRFDGVETAR